VSWTIHIAPEAEAELEASARWYGEHAGLRFEFIQAIDEAIAAITESPLRSPLWRPGSLYRKHVIRRIPYVIFYRIVNDVIEVMAFAHAKRRAGYWLDRR
jgi:plasmid stabilization system protein ParE